MNAAAIGIAALFGLLLFAGRRRASASETAAARQPVVPPEVEDAARKAGEGTASPEELDEAAIKARESGLPATADALEAEAERLAAQEGPAAPAEPAPSAPAPRPLAATLESPWETIPDEAWTAFTRTQRQGKVGTVTANYHLGMFLNSAMVLQDFGLMTGVKKREYKGRQVWMGDWVPPHSEEVFLTTPQLQYEVFKRQMVMYANVIFQQYPEAIGLDVEGQIATLSGLLAVSKQAGPVGLGRWIKGDRRPGTNEAYKAANGIF